MTLRLPAWIGVAATVATLIPASLAWGTTWITMRDGVRLAADVYLPTGTPPWPVILTRTPYNRQTDAVDPEWIQDVNNRGYVYVVQDMRGRFESEGADSVFWTDGWGALQDGYDTIEWIAVQSWCDGNVGMHGGSARGIVQYRAAGAAPPSLKACVARSAVEDFYHKGFFQGGELRKSLVEGWFASIGSLDFLPFYLAHPTHDAFWDLVDLATRATEVTVPTLHIAGFYDIFSESAIDAFNVLQAHGGTGAAGNQRLVIGPWTHWNIEGTTQGELTYPSSAYYDLNEVRWRWYDRWLKGEMNGVDQEPAASYYLMGDVDDPQGPGNEWIDTEQFPVVAPVSLLYLHTSAVSSMGELRVSPPTTSDEGVNYVHDPVNPMLTLGGNNLFGTWGPYDQRPVHQDPTQFLSARTDVLIEPLVVSGKVQFHFWAECTTIDTDWCVKLIDVYPDGREMLVTDGILRGRFRGGFEDEVFIEPGKVTEYVIDLWTTAVAFNAGHALQITVSGSNFPRFEINPNTGAPFGDFDDPVAADVRIRHDADYPSHLHLPVVAGMVDVVAAEEPRRPLRVRLAHNPAPHFVVTVESGDPHALMARVLDVTGRQVRALTVGGMGGGTRLVWDGRGEGGASVAPGVYYLNIATPRGDHLTERLILLR